MHGKGSFAVIFLVAAFAVPPTLYYRAWKPAAEEPSVQVPTPPVVIREEPVSVAPPAPIKAAPVSDIPEVVVIKRDPTLSPSDFAILNKPPEMPAPPPVIEAPPPPRPRPARLAVHGIIAIDGQDRRAIINGRETGVGETVGRARVVGIDLDGVTFRSRGKTFKKKVGD